VQHQVIGSKLDMQNTVQYFINPVHQIVQVLIQLGNIDFLCCFKCCVDFCKGFHLSEVVLEFLIDLFKLMSKFGVELSKHCLSLVFSV